MESSDVRLLLDLLKEDRQHKLLRIEDQRKKIVELTAKCDALSAKVSESSDESQTEQKVRELETQLSQKDIMLCSVQKQLQETKSALTSVIDKQAAELSDASAELESLRDKCALLTRDKKGLTAQLTSKNLMVDYAKAKGFEFLRLERMKAFVCQNDNEDAEAVANESKTLADVFGDMDKDVASFDAVLSDITHDVSAEFADAVAMDKQKCPFGVESALHKSAIVGGLYCRKKCPWNEGMDYDQNIVHCMKKK